MTKKSVNNLQSKKPLIDKSSDLIPGLPAKL